MEKYLRIGKEHLKFNLLPHLFLAVLMLCISPLFMGVENLDANRTARVLEMYVAIIGIILLLPVCIPEQNTDILDLVRTKATSYTMVIVIRIFIAVISLSILIGIYVLILRENQCTFPVLKYYLGTLAEAFFLGSMGLFSYLIFNRIAVAYMLPTMYYISCFGSGKNLLKNFYLFSMSYGEYKQKWYLFVGGLTFILLGIAFLLLFQKLKVYVIRLKINRA